MQLEQLRIKEVREPGDDREFDHAFCPFCKVAPGPYVRAHVGA